MNWEVALVPLIITMPAPLWFLGGSATASFILLSREPSPAYGLGAWDAGAGGAGLGTSDAPCAIVPMPMPMCATVTSKGL